MAEISAKPDVFRVGVTGLDQASCLAACDRVERGLSGPLVEVLPGPTGCIPRLLLASGEDSRAVVAADLRLRGLKLVLSVFFLFCMKRMITVTVHTFLTLAGYF